jgi:hypothetical protein
LPCWYRNRRRSVHYLGHTQDFNGDGDDTEGLAEEMMTYGFKIYRAIQAYAANVAGTPIVFDPTHYPYWFTDTNGNGVADPDEAVYPNAYASRTPPLLRATYNFTYDLKDLSSSAHYGLYMLQVLYDTLADLGWDVSGKLRPE